MTSTTLEALRAAKAAMGAALAGRGACGVPGAECPLQDAGKPWHGFAIAVASLDAAIAAEEARLPLDGCAGFVQAEGCDGDCLQPGCVGTEPAPDTCGRCGQPRAAHEAAKPDPIEQTASEQIIYCCDKCGYAGTTQEHANCGAGSDAGLRERLRVLVLGLRRSAALANDIVAEEAFTEAARRVTAALLEQAPSAPAPDVVLVGPGASMTREGGKVVVRCAAPTEREAALVTAARELQAASAYFANCFPQRVAMETSRPRVLRAIDSLRDALAAYEERT